MAGQSIARARRAAAGPELVQLDEIARGIGQEELLRFRPDMPGIVR